MMNKVDVIDQLTACNLRSENDNDDFDDDFQPV